MDSRETTARAQFQEKLQSRHVRETLEAEVNSGPNCVLAWVLSVFCKRLNSKILCEIAFSSCPELSDLPYLGRVILLTPPPSPVVPTCARGSPVLWLFPPPPPHPPRPLGNVTERTKTKDIPGKIWRLGLVEGLENDGILSGKEGGSGVEKTNGAQGKDKAFRGTQER